MTREVICALWREGAAPADGVPSGVLAEARSEGLHLLLADRLGLQNCEAMLRDAVVLEECDVREQRAVLAALSGAGLRPVLLKGAAMAHGHYVRPELRPRSDTDLIIPAAARDAVTPALETIGYERMPEADGEHATGQFHFGRHDHHGTFHALDVHWRVSNARVFADALTYEELARDAVSLPSLGPDALGPSRVHALLLACVHLVAHHADAGTLLWLYDVHLLARSLTHDERDEFIALASAKRMRAVCASTLCKADEAFGGVDDRLVAALSDAGAGEEPSAAFLGGRLRQVDVLKTDLAATPHWRQRLALLKEHAFPQRAFMYERYRIRQPLMLPWLYLHRIVTGLPKWFRR